MSAVPHGGLTRRLRRLLPFVRPHRRLLAYAVLSGLIHHVCMIGSGVVAASLVGRAVTGATVDELLPGVVLLLVLVAPLILAPWSETQLAHVMAFRILVDVRAKVYAAFERLAPAGLMRRRSGDAGTAAISDVELLEVFFAHTLSQLISAVIVPVGAVVAAAFIDPFLALVLVPVLVAAGAVPARLRPASVRSGAQMRRQLGELNADIVEGVQGLREVLAAGAGERHVQRLDEGGRRLYAARRHHARRAGIESAATDAVVTAGVLAVLVTAGLLVTSGRLDPPLLPVAVVLCALSFAPVVVIVDVARELSIVAAAADRVGTLLDAPDAVADVPGPDVRLDAPSLVFRDVSFRYGPDLPPVLHRVSFEVRRGETVALVGHSGAGKSTCANLALRLWDVDDGAVLLGGQDIRTVPTAQLRATVAYVPQDVHLFNQSIADNIRLGRPDASPEQVRTAARQALVADLVDQLPDGYETRVGELGNTLSGGQRQRLAIARALLLNAPVMVLDEAVANLDLASERELRVAMDNARQGRTVLVIAHRLSTIAAADRVVMLEQGRVVATGSHTELFAASTEYRRLLGSQQQTLDDHAVPPNGSATGDTRTITASTT